jgi:hypothetical protein
MTPRRIVGFLVATVVAIWVFTSMTPPAQAATCAQLNILHVAFVDGKTSFLAGTEVSWEVRVQNNSNAAASVPSVSIIRNLSNNAQFNTSHTFVFTTNGYKNRWQGWETETTQSTGTYTLEVTIEDAGYNACPQVTRTFQITAPLTEPDLSIVVSGPTNVDIGATYTFNFDERNNTEGPADSYVTRYWWQDGG